MVCLQSEEKMGKTEFINFKKEDNTIDPMYIKKTLNANKYDNLDEMNQFLERYNLSRLTYTKKNLNKTTSVKDSEIINNLPKLKAPSPDGFTV